jgi:hypothetical protein
LSNRADPQNPPEELSTLALAQGTENGGPELREEVVYDSLQGVEALPWSEATERFGTWYDDQRKTEIVISNEAGEMESFPTPNRFTPEYREMLYAKSQALERGLRKRWGKLLHTAMITLTASTTDEDGDPRPPVEHLNDLLGSWEAVRRELARVLDGREWEYLAILEPHKSGYVHIHLAVFVKGPIVPEQFRSVLDAHLRNCEGAGEEAHRIFDEDGEPDTVSVRHVSHPSRNDGVENLGAYLAAYMAGEYGAEATEMPEHVQRFYAVMWATGRQWFRPSNGAQELMQPEDDEDDGQALDWEVIGIAPEGEPEDEIIEIDPESAGGVQYRQVRHDPVVGDPEPPPDEWGGVEEDRRHWGWRYRT